jgi:hypothetical protein
MEFHVQLLPGRLLQLLYQVFLLLLRARRLLGLQLSCQVMLLVLLARLLLGLQLSCQVMLLVLLARLLLGQLQLLSQVLLQQTSLYIVSLISCN